MKRMVTSSSSSSLSWVYLAILSFCLFSQVIGIAEAGRQGFWLQPSLVENIDFEGSDTAVEMNVDIQIHAQGERIDSNSIHRGHEHYRGSLRRRKLDTVIDPDERLPPEQRKQKRMIKTALRVNGTAPDPVLLQQLSTPQPPPAKEAPKEKPKSPVNFLQANEQEEHPTKPPESYPPAAPVKPMPMKIKPAPQTINKPAPQMVPAMTTDTDSENEQHTTPLQPGFRKNAMPNQQATTGGHPSMEGAGTTPLAGGLNPSTSSTIGLNKVPQVEKKEKQDGASGKENEKEEQKQQLNHAFANVLSVLEFGKSKDSKSSPSKTSTSILSKPDLIPGVLRSIPVSNALAIRPTPPTSDNSVRGGSMTIDVKTG
jgi:hypothetical protein